MPKASKRSKQPTPSQPVVRHSLITRPPPLTDPEAMRWRQIPWNKIPQDSRADVLPFLSVQDNVELDIALLNDEECRDDYLLSHENKAGLPAYDNWVYTNADNFQGLRWVMKRGIKLNTLRMRVGEEDERGSRDTGLFWMGELGETDRDRVLFCLVDNLCADIAREYVRINSDVEDVTAEHLQDGDPVYTRTLRLASEHGLLEVVDALIATGADVNEADDDGSTPIDSACYEGHLQVVQALVAAGADVNKADNDGRTPIFWASSHGHLEVVQVLRAAGATQD